MELIKITETAGIRPKVLYKRIKVENFTAHFSHKIDYGFGYLLRRIRVKYPGIVAPDTASEIPLREASTYYLSGTVTRYPDPGTGMTAFPDHLVLEALNNATTNSGVIQATSIVPGATIVDGAQEWIVRDRLLDFGHKVEPLQMSILDCANNMPRQPSPIPVDLQCSPGRENSYMRRAPNPVDNKLYSMNNSANQSFFSSTLNYLYRFADLIWVEFNGIEQLDMVQGGSIRPFSVTPFFSPSYIDVMIEGYYVPEKAFEMWQGATI